MMWIPFLACSVTNVLATRFMRPHLLPPLLFKLCWPSGYRKQIDGVRCLHKITDEIIERRRQQLMQQQEEKQSERRPDQAAEPSRAKRSALLDTLLQASLEDAPLSDAQIRDEVNTFIFEGHDTTTSAASFCLYLLSRHATVQQRLFDELYSHYGADVARPVVYSDFAALSYLHCVVKESLRLYPPIPAVGRSLEKDLVVGEQFKKSQHAIQIILSLTWQMRHWCRRALMSLCCCGKCCATRNTIRNHYDFGPSDIWPRTLCMIRRASPVTYPLVQVRVIALASGLRCSS